MGLSAGGLIHGGAYPRRGLYFGVGQKQGKSDDNIIRQNENLCLKKLRKCIVLCVYLLIKEKL